MVQQFFISMKSCIELVLSREVPSSLHERSSRIRLKIFVIREVRIKLGTSGTSRATGDVLEGIEDHEKCQYGEWDPVDAKQAAHRSRTRTERD